MNIYLFIQCGFKYVFAAIDFYVVFLYFIGWNNLKDNYTYKGLLPRNCEISCVMFFLAHLAYLRTEYIFLSFSIMVKLTQIDIFMWLLQLQHYRGL